MAVRSEAEVTSLLVYKSPAWKGGVLYFHRRCGLGGLTLRASNEGLPPFSPAHPSGAETPRFPTGRALREQENRLICAPYSPDC